MENEIMNNEEVMETVEDIAAEDSGRGSMLIGIGLTVLAGVAIYKISKVVIAKVKKRKEEKAKVIEADTEESQEDVESICEDAND